MIIESLLCIPRSMLNPAFAFCQECRQIFHSPKAIATSAGSQSEAAATSIDRFGCCRHTSVARCTRLYAFARITDDLSDCHEPSSLRTQWLDWWRKTTALNLITERQSERVVLAEGLAESTANWPIDLHRRAAEIMPALRDSTRRFNIPTRYLLEIVDGVLADQQKTRFDTYEQLEHYCYLVASSVGLACLHIWEFDEPLPLSAAVDCGLAFQLTNILRDISEDADRGRIYLPRQHYEQHGICEDDLLNPRRDDRLTCLIVDEVARARTAFRFGMVRLGFTERRRPTHV